MFIDYNQNARDRTVASAYSVRPMPDARVSAPIAWDEVAEVEPEAYTLRTMPDRLREVGDPGAAIADEPGSLDPLLTLARRTRRTASTTHRGRRTSRRATTSRRAWRRRGPKLAEWETWKQEQKRKPRGQH